MAMVADDWPQALWTLRADGSVRDYNMAMSACEKGSQWLLALRLFSNMRIAASEPNLASYSILMAAWGKASHWHHAFQVFANLCGRPSLLVDVVCFASIISCCERTSRWQKSMELFQELQEQRVRANIICYSALISSFEKGFQWQFSMAAFHQMEMSQLVPDVICYSALLSSFEKGLQWQWSLHFFQVMSRKKLRPNSISYHAAISAAEKSGKWQLAQHFFVAMRTQVLKQNVVSCNVSSVEFQFFFPPTAECFGVFSHSKGFGADRSSSKTHSPKVPRFQVKVPK